MLPLCVAYIGNHKKNYNYKLHCLKLILETKLRSFDFAWEFFNKATGKFEWTGE